MCGLGHRLSSELQAKKYFAQQNMEQISLFGCFIVLGGVLVLVPCLVRWRRICPGRVKLDDESLADALVHPSRYREGYSLCKVAKRQAGGLDVSKPWLGCIVWG